MDTSEQYVKMRIAAIPDMGYGTPMLETFRSENYHTVDEKNYDIWIGRDGNWYVCSPLIEMDEAKERGRVCQLERQDQLQEMVWDCYPKRSEDDPRHVWQLTYAFVDFLASDTQDDKTWPLETTSMEQLWLAFYMNEKHNKTWDGAVWIPQNANVSLVSGARR